MNKIFETVKNYFDLNKKSGHTVQVQMFVPEKERPSKELTKEEKEEVKKILKEAKEEVKSRTGLESFPDMEMALKPEPEKVHEKEESVKETIKSLSFIKKIFLYFGIFLGVFFSDFVYQYQSDLSNFHFSIGGIIFSIAISICLIPLVYDKLKIKPGSPYIYQFSLFFQQGILWKTIFQLF